MKRLFFICGVFLLELTRVFDSFNNLCHFLNHLYRIVPCSSLKASAPSITEATSFTSALVGVKLVIIVSIIWVATTGIPFFALNHFF
jgi:hypothetical protein